MRFVIVPFVTVFLLTAAAPGQSQVETREGIALQNQIYQLRQELKSVQDQASRGAGAGNRAPAYVPPPQPQYGGSDLLAQLLNRVDALEDQVRQLRGRIDETQNQLQRQNDELNKRIGDLAFQTNLSGGQSSTASPPPPRQPPPPPRAAAPPGPRTPEVALQEGNAALARRDYSAAESAAREVLANRTSPRAYDAQLLLAEALSGQRQHAQAAIAYDDAYNRSRNGNRAQDALLGLANSLTAINEKKAACDTLARLRNDFPQTRTEVRDGAAATAQKAGCH